MAETVEEIRDLRTKYHDALYGVDDEDVFEEEQDVLTTLAEIDRLEARLALAVKVCEALGGWRRKPNMYTSDAHHAMRETLNAHDVYLAGKGAQ